MDVVDFEFEVIKISISISLSFNNLDAVVNAFHSGCCDMEQEVVKNSLGMAAQFPGESDQELDTGAKCLQDPIVEIFFCLVSAGESPEETKFFLEDISNIERLVEQPKSV